MLVYKYRGGDDEIFERDLLSLKRNLFFAPKQEWLNDPCETLILTDKFVQQTKSISFLLGKDKMKHLDEVERALHNVFNVRKKSIGIYSLSKTYNDELLWAHYANSHKGFCIEYDLDELLKINKSFGLYYFDVEYDKKPPQYTIKDINNKSNKDIVKKIAGYKSLRWKYEQEYRIVTDFFGNHSYSFNAVKAIYFGLNMDENQKKELVNTLKGRGIKFYQMKQINKTYQFERKLLNDVSEENQTYFKEIPCDISENGGISINILSQEFHRKDKGTVNIEIDKPINKKSILWLAEKIKEEIFFDADRIFIFYYLKNDTVKNSCWATSHYSPKLEINIMGASEESLEELNKKKVKGEIISVWKDNDSMMPKRMFLVKDDNKLFMKTLFAKTKFSGGSEMIEEITNTFKNGITKLDYDNGHGEYFVIEKNGNLGLYNNNGKFEEAIKESRNFLDILKII